MATIAKKDISFRRQDRATDRVLSNGYEPIFFAHEFTVAGQTDIDLNALVAPTDMAAAGFSNPSVAKLLSGHIYLYRHRLELTSTSKGKLMDYLSYDVISNSVIRLKAGLESDVNEVITGVIYPVPITGTPIADIKPIAQTGSLAVGLTDFLVNEYFEVNKYSGQQVGDVLVIRNGVVQRRNANNSVSGAGDYYEIPPGVGYLSNTIRFNTAPVSTPDNIMVISTGLKTERPQEGAVARIESLAGQMDLVIQDLAVATGNPVTKYQAAPNSVDTMAFGKKVNAVLTDVFADAIVAPAAYVSAGYATHTSLQAAISGISDGQKIFIVEGTYSGNVSITKKVTIEGKGHASYVSGTMTFTSGADYSSVKNIRIGGNVTINSGADGIFLRDCWLTSGSALTNNGSGNSVLVIQE